MCVGRFTLFADPETPGRLRPGRVGLCAGAVVQYCADVAGGHSRA